MAAALLVHGGAVRSPTSSALCVAARRPRTLTSTMLVQRRRTLSSSSSAPPPPPPPTASASAAELRRTALHALNVELGARLVDFHGWHMPMQYTESIVASHAHVRSHAGLFDVSHMLQARVEGDGALALVERAFVADATALGNGAGCYTLMLNANGGIVDDAIVCRESERAVVVVLNSACADKDMAHLRALLAAERSAGTRAGDAQLCVVDRALLALQGPLAARVLSSLCVSDDVRARVASMPFMSRVRSVPLRVGDVGVGVGVDVMRCGYTGEDGFELSVDNGDAERVARALLGVRACDVDAGAGAVVLPIGLGARDSLRLEAGLCLYGNDLDETTTPAEATLLWTISKRRRAAGGFVGAERVQAQLADAAATVERKRVGLVVARGSARDGARVLAPAALGASDVAADQRIGVVTSGTFSPTLRKGVSMAYVRPEHAKRGSAVAVEAPNGKLVAATVEPMPFVPTHYVAGSK